MTYIDGMFYIDNTTGDFWLRVSSAWVLKGNIRTAGRPILGFTGEGPFVANERFALAPTPTAIKFPAALAALSSAIALFAPIVDSSFVLTADPNEYMASGDGVICTVTFVAGSQIGAFIWNCLLYTSPSPR